MSDRIEKLIAFLQQSPNDCFLNHALALEYIKIGKEEDAKLLFEKHLNNDPQYIATYYHLGKLMERTGAPQDAVRIYEEGMKQAKSANEMHTYNELQGAYEDLVY